MVRHRRPAVVAVSAAPDTAEITVIGDTSGALVQASGRADLLVLGSSATGEFQGSVVAHCVQHAVCPVVVIPPQFHKGQ